MSLLTRPLFRARQGVVLIQRGIKKKRRIPVTLIEDVPMVGSAGTVAHVSKAYMRHKLFPKRLAEYVLSYSGPLDRNKIEREEQAEEIKASETSEDTQQRVHQLALRNQETIGRIVDMEPLVFERNVVTADSGENQGAQAIYGSLSKADVVRALADMHGISLDKEALVMDDKIKSVGEYTCVVKLAYAGQASLKVKVVPTADK
ncbi:hypothetical protein H4R20_003108 [Coemansia guatemalensis]|uniref:50S ribosomal protein L9, chloroplastic n=1 Tax=Coemansia guatemalensis TaxID=2761395 RepID=A0A9W8I090_9FUNG|nr:hypothetical protein H4R20_003108 [Coemansia guatemalensis]